MNNVLNLSNIAKKIFKPKSFIRPKRNTYVKMDEQFLVYKSFFVLNIHVINGSMQS